MKKSKYIVLVFFGLLAANISLLAQNTFIDSLSAKGEKAYLSKNYDEAILNYEKILNEGYDSAELYYNLGNAYYRKGILGRAILNYEKGLKLKPGDEDLLYNLKIANAHIIDKINNVPEFFIVRWWKDFVALFSIEFLSVILLVAFLLLLIFVWLFFFGKTPSVRKRGLFGGVSFAFIVLLFAVVYFGKVKEVNNSNYAIILSKEVTARTSPDESSKAIFVLHEGTKVSVLDNVGEWEQVKLSDGKKGWIKKGNFELID